MDKFLLLTLLALGYQSASAQLLVTESFGTGANAFTMDFVTIGNPGNAADTTGSPIPAGSVAYIYNLGKHEVSRDMITKANAAGSLGLGMTTILWYEAATYENRPATGLSWSEAAKYVNYLNTSQGYHKAYNFVANGTLGLWLPWNAGYNANNMLRNSLAKYVIASSNEWYKGAYGKADGSWSNFANGTDSAPTPVAGGTDTNTAVYGQGVYSGAADITNAGGLSEYGTMGQGGNVSEWTETAYDGTNNFAAKSKEVRGGSWISLGYAYSGGLDASSRYWSGGGGYNDADGYNGDFGFRVASVPSLSASVPEPSTLSLLAIGLSGLALVRRRKQS